MASVDRATLASMIDHTLLAPEARRSDIEAVADDAVRLGVAAVCVHPRWAGVAADRVGGALPVASVVGFPSGAHRSEVKADEATRAVDDGAREIDMVVPLGDVLDGNWGRVEADVVGVRDAIGRATLLKVIVESAALPDERLAEVCRRVVDAGADYVKTSTGFHPAGGASVEAVAAMRAAVGPSVGVKASGGVRDAATALAMVDAGATRIGASASEAILDGLAPEP